MNKRIIIGFVVLVNIILCGKTVLASENVDHEASHKEKGGSGFELGLSVGYAYLKTEEDNAPALHYLGKIKKAPCTGAFLNHTVFNR